MQPGDCTLIEASTMTPQGLWWMRAGLRVRQRWRFAYRWCGSLIWHSHLDSCPMRQGSLYHLLFWLMLYTLAHLRADGAYNLTIMLGSGCLSVHIRYAQIVERVVPLPEVVRSSLFNVRPLTMPGICLENCM